MVPWVKRLSGLASSVLLFAFVLYGYSGIALIGGTLNLLWIVNERWARRSYSFLRSWILVLNTAFAAYGIWSGGPPLLALFLAGSSLLAWNGGLFLERWSDPPVAVQYLYLRRIGILLALGLSAGVSALSLQGSFRLPFFAALLVLLVSGMLWLRLISKAIRRSDSG